jgi:hypothetical protein
MTSRLKAPSPGLAVGIVALVVAFSGTAYAVTSSQVTIVDGTSGDAATVDPTGHVKVGDGDGPLTVNGTVNGRVAPPATYFHASVSSGAGSACLSFDMPPAGKALVVRSAVVDVIGDSTPTTYHLYNLWLLDQNHTCADGSQVYVGHVSVDPGSGNPLQVNFDPGIAVPEGAHFAVNGGGAVGDLDAEIFIYGYTVPSAQVPSL